MQRRRRWRAYRDNILNLGTGLRMAGIGVSEFGRDGDTIDTILRVADERMYDAKHQKAATG
jgi:GGDEF domain-containing protein